MRVLRRTLGFIRFGPTAMRAQMSATAFSYRNASTTAHEQVSSTLLALATAARRRRHCVSAQPHRGHGSLDNDCGWHGQVR